MAAGTGGHIYPGIAVGFELMKRDWNVVWLGTKIGIENEIVEKNNIKLYKISFEGVRKKGFLSIIFSPFKLLRAIFQSLVIIWNVKPRLVLGMGGYVSLPGSIASYLLRRQIIIHEQNTIPGMSNRICSIFAKKILTGFPVNLKNSFQTGNPIREEISALREIKMKKKISSDV